MEYPDCKEAIGNIILPAIYQMRQTSSCGSTLTLMYVHYVKMIEALHVLSACPLSLQLYTWSHDKVLEVVMDLVHSVQQTTNRL